MQQLQYEALRAESHESQERSQPTHAVQDIVCPQCGSVNEPEARYCASCGSSLGLSTCPNCGAALEPDADLCEVCQHYIRKDVCSFCGASISNQDAFCPECGSPRGGIVCPVCHTLNDFSFCKQCGTPLTEDARQLEEQVSQLPELRELRELASELQRLELVKPYSSERELLRDERNVRLRERVLTLLAQDRGTDHPTIPEPGNKRMSMDEYHVRKEQYRQQLTALLEKMAQTPQVKPALVRNYAMACKPHGVRLGWECNFKHALHSSPCGCAKPQLGGKWVVLGSNTKKETKDE